jgi:hypothetical protein
VKKPLAKAPALRPALPGWAAAAVLLTSSLPLPGCGGITDAGRAPTRDASADADAPDDTADGAVDSGEAVDGGLVTELDAAGGICPLVIEDAGVDGEDPTPGICGGIC